MVSIPRKVEIRDGKIELPDDMLEQSGIGTSDGTVIVDLRASGEIVLRANAAAPQDPPLSPALAAIRAYARKRPPNVQAMQDDAWDEAIAHGIADHYRRSMKDADGGT